MPSALAAATADCSQAHVTWQHTHTPAHTPTCRLRQPDGTSACTTQAAAGVVAALAPTAAWPLPSPPLVAAAPSGAAPRAAALPSGGGAAPSAATVPSGAAAALARTPPDSQPPRAARRFAIWEVELRHTFVRYPPEAQRVLEEAYGRGLACVKLHADGRLYEVSLRGEQRQRLASDPSRSRKVRRREETVD
jgi:hypothetical protein